MTTDLSSLEGSLAKLLVDTVKLLHKKVKEGTVSPTDISNIIKLCRDNGITVDAKSGDPLGFLKDLENIELDDFTQ